MSLPQIPAPTPNVPSLPAATNDLLARLQAQAAPPANMPPPVPVPPPPVASAAAPTDALSRLRALQAQAAPPPPPAPEPMPTPGTWYADSAGAAVYPCACGMHVTVEACRASRGVCPACQTAIPGAEIICGEKFGTINPVESNLPVPPHVVAPVAAPTPTPEKKSGRPKLPRDEHGNIIRTKSGEMAAAVPPPTPAQAAPPPIPAPTPLPVAAAPAVVPGPAPVAAVTTPIGLLLVDCLPTSGAASAETEIFAPCRAAIKQIHNVDDYRMIDYGKGAGFFAAAVAAWLTQSGKTWSMLYVDSSSVDASNVLPVLVGHSGGVIRGLR